MPTSVDSIYHQVRDMTANFEFKPEERINESMLSKQLGASRTPLREALNRLVAEGLLIAKEGKGFFCRTLSPETIINLYELRDAIEQASTRLAVQRASDQDLKDLRRYLEGIKPLYVSNAPARDIVRFDEEFHIRLATLARNPELLKALQNVYQQIRYVRRIAMQYKKDITHAAHSDILEAVEARDEALAVARISDHVHTSTDEATETVREAYSQLYVPH